MRPPFQLLIPDLNPGHPHDEYGHLSSYYTDWGNQDAAFLVNLVRREQGLSSTPVERFKFNIGDRPETFEPDHWVIDFYPLVESGNYFKHDASR